MVIYQQTEEPAAEEAYTESEQAHRRLWASVFLIAIIAFGIGAVGFALGAHYIASAISSGH